MSYPSTIDTNIIYHNICNFIGGWIPIPIPIYNIYTVYRIYSRNSRSEDDALWQTEENVDEESESEEDYSSKEESNDA